MSEEVTDQHRSEDKYHSGIPSVTHNQGGVCQVTPKYIWENGGRASAGVKLSMGGRTSRGGGPLKEKRSEKANGDGSGAHSLHSTLLHFLKTIS